MFEQFLEQFSQQLGETVALVSDLPGSLAYHLALLTFLMGVVVNALQQLGRGGRERSTYHIRLALGAVGLFTLQLTYFFIVILSSVLPFDPVSVLPPIDRAVGLLSILLALWLLAFPNGSRWGDVLTGLSVVLIFLAAGAAVWVWFPIAQTGAVAHPGCNNIPDLLLNALFFNCTQSELPWEIAKMGLLGIGLIGYMSALIARRRADWLLASGYAALMLTGHILHFVYSNPANVPGIERLAELLALPFLLAVLTRRIYQPALQPLLTEPITATPTSIKDADTAPHPAVTPAPALPAPLPLANAINSKAALALASLSTTTDRDELIQIICVAMAHTFRAEACGWLDPPDHPGGPRLAGGYDVAREQFITARPFMLSETPEVAAALKQTAPTLLTLDEMMSDLRRVARAMGREPTTPVLVAPLRPEGGPVVGALLLFTAQTAWSADEHSLLAALSDSLAATLRHAAQGRDDLDEARTQAAEAQQSFASVQTSLSQSAEELNLAREQAQKRAAELTEAQAEIERQRQTADRLAAQLQTQQQAEASHIGLMGDVNELRHKLLFAQREAEDNARLEAELDAALARIEALAEFENQLETAQRAAEEYRGQESQLREELKQLRAEWAQRDTATTGADALQFQQDLELVRTELTVAQALGPLLAAAQMELAEKTERLTQAQTREAELLSEHEQTHAQAAQWQSETERLRAELEQAHTPPPELAENTTALAQLQNREAQLLIEIDQVRVQAQADLAEVNTLLALTQEQEQKAQQEVTRLQAGLAQAQPPDAQLPTTQTELAAALARAEQTQSELERARAELTLATAAQAELASLADRLARTQTQEAQFQQEVETLRAGLAQMQALGPMLAATKIALAEATADLARSQAQETLLRQELENARVQAVSASTGTEKPNQELERLRLEFNRAISQRMALQVQLDDKTRALTLLQTELFERTNELDALRQDYQEQALHMQEELVQARSQLERGGTRPLKLPTAAQPAEGQTTADLEVVNSLTQELRQPMSSISGYTDLLLSESVGILGALQRKFLERIKASSERMGALLDDLIHVTVLDSGGLELKAESLDVAMVIEEAVLGCEAQFRERGVELILDIAAESPRLHADRDALRQIFTHLLNNAAAVSPSDSEVTLTVRREVEPGNRLGEKANYLFISVSDAGGGIAPEDQPRVFSRLYRADSPLVAGVGDTGVGLSMVKALVEAHGGRVWVESELKKGSVFHVLMPLDQPVSKSGNNGSVPPPAVE